MKFELNSAISQHLGEYNLQSTTRTSSTTQLPAVVARDWLVTPENVSSYRTTLGAPERMIPFEVVPEKAQNNAVADINACGVEHRIRVWRNAANRIIAFISHYESMWSAFWLAPAGSDYLYGATACCKDTAAVRQKVFDRGRYRVMASTAQRSPANRIGNQVTEGFSAEAMERVKYGRCYYLRTTVLITRDLITQGFIYPVWRQLHECNFTDSKGSDQRKVANEIVQDFKTHPVIPYWVDETFLLSKSRLVDNINTIWYCLESTRRKCFPSGSEYFLSSKIVPYAEFHHTVEWWTAYFSSQFTFGEYQSLTSEFINKPAVQALLRKAVNDTQTIFDLAQGDDPAHWNKQRVGAPMLNFDHWLWWCNTLRKVWPDCSQDVLVNHFDLLQHLRPDTMKHLDDLATVQWLSNNMPINSLLSIFEKGIAKVHAEWDGSAQRLRYTSNSLYADEGRNNIILYQLNDLKDTFNSIYDIMRAGRELPKPSRWRLAEFHDHVVAESWKIRNTDYELPQDLFPKPFHTKVGDTKFTIIQPISAHQLAQWGQAARNCVGGSGYSSDIRAKKHFILMIMLDNKPRYTVQLKLRGQSLDVVQIKDIGNRQLSQDEQDKVEAAIGTALLTREQELNKDAAESLDLQLA